MLKEYYGTKKLKATPMTRGEYNKFRGWTLPAKEDGDEQGYLVEYMDGGKANVEGHEGYVSWSPKDVFEASYQETGCMSFGHALVALQAGHKVSRAGWNGKGMFLYYVPENKYQAQTDVAKAYWAERQPPKVEGATAEPIMVPYGAYIAMKTAQENVVPWLASQTDVLSNDWGIVP